MPNVLITGGAGFIGHHLVKRLTETDSDITIIDNLSNANNNFLRKVKNAMQVQSHNSSRFIRLRNEGNDKTNISLYVDDIRNKEAITQIMKADRIDTCFHLASKISVPESVRNPKDTFDVNIRGTYNVLEACSAGNIKNIVFASSSAVYGEPAATPIPEEHPLDPLSPYGESKIACEALISSFKTSGKIRKGTSLRIFNVYGEGQNREYAGVITKFAQRLSSRLPPILYGDGNQIRDFIFIDDVVDAMLSAADLSKKQEFCSSEIEVFNLATGTATKIKDLAELMINIFGLDLKPIFAEGRKGDILRSLANVARLRTELGFIPTHDIGPSLKRLFNPGRNGSD